MGGEWRAIPWIKFARVAQRIEQRTRLNRSPEREVDCAFDLHRSAGGELRFESFRPQCLTQFRERALLERDVVLAKCSDEARLLRLRPAGEGERHRPGR